MGRGPPWARSTAYERPPTPFVHPGSGRDPPPRSANGTPVAAIADDVVAPQEREVLGHPRVAHLEHLSEEVDVVLARAQLLDDPHAVRMGEGAEQLSELLGRDDSCSHVLIFAYMKAKRHRRA